MSKGKGKNRKLTIEMVYDIENVRQADIEARKGKGEDYGVRKFDKKREDNLHAISDSIKNRTFETMPPVFEKRHCDKKDRILSKVHYPYHVAHHALMRIILPTLERSYFYESAASIKGRGIHYAASHARKWIDKNKCKPIFWVQVDFTKFYHYVVRQKIYDRLCRTFTNEGIRWMLHDVIWALRDHNGLEPSDGTRGLGIGLYPVQPLVNFYLNDLDREIAKFDVFNSRYCDNILLMGHDPKELWRAVKFIQRFADADLDQPLHDNIGIQKLDEVHPVDYAGYLFYPYHTYVRKETKYRLKRKYKQTENNPKKRRQMLSSYKGWLQHCNGLTLWQKVTGMKSFSELGIKRNQTMRNGQRYFECPEVKMYQLVGKEIVVKDFVDDAKTRYGEGRLCVLIEENVYESKFFSNNQKMKDTLNQVKEMNELPFKTVIQARQVSNNKTDYYFT